MSTTSPEAATSAPAQPDTAAAATNAPASTAAAATPAAGNQPAAATPTGDAQPAAAPAAEAAKPAEAKPSDEGKKDDAAPAGAPEKYEFKQPDGYEVDSTLLDAFSPVLKDLNLSQEQAQKVVDFAPKLIEATQTRTAAAVLDQLGLKDFASWPSALKADKELGGEKLQENLAVAKLARETFFSPQLSELIDKTGMGNHPEMVRALFKVGRLIKEDGFVGGGKGAGPTRDARSVYSASNMNP